MHPLVALVGWVIAIIVTTLVVRALNKDFPHRMIPTMAVIGAGLFVAQMLNFPIGAGVTGHLVGAALAAILLGPLAGFTILVTILMIQSLLFGDGGITALGLNIINMAFIGCFLGWAIYRAFPERYEKAGIFVASWTVVFVGSLACAAELAGSFAISGGAFGIPGIIAFPTMLLFHAIIGIGEAIITVGVVSYVSEVSPDLMYSRASSPSMKEAVPE
jgi:cobalt/nickel transport system permease protein